MTRYEVAMLKAGEQMDTIVHDIIGHGALGDSSPVRPYSTNTNWAKVAQLHLTQNYGQGTLLLQDIYDQKAKTHKYAVMWRLMPQSKPMFDDQLVWIMADTEEMALCRALVMAHFGHYTLVEDNSLIFF